MSLPEKNKACRLCGEATNFGDHTLCRRKAREDEDERRLSRYDRALELLRLTQKLDGLSFDDEDKIKSFLAEEPK